MLGRNKNKEIDKLKAKYATNNKTPEGIGELFERDELIEKKLKESKGKQVEAIKNLRLILDLKQLAKTIKRPKEEEVNLKESKNDYVGFILDSLIEYMQKENHATHTIHKDYYINTVNLVNELKKYLNKQRKNKKSIYLKDKIKIEVRQSQEKNKKTNQKEFTISKITKILRNEVKRYTEETIITTQNIECENLTQRENSIEEAQMQKLNAEAVLNHLKNKKNN